MKKALRKIYYANNIYFTLHHFSYFQVRFSSRGVTPRPPPSCSIPTGGVSCTAGSTPNSNKSPATAREGSSMIPTATAGGNWNPRRTPPPGPPPTPPRPSGRRLRPGTTRTGTTARRRRRTPASNTPREEVIPYYIDLKGLAMNHCSWDSKFLNVN